MAIFQQGSFLIDPNTSPDVVKRKRAQIQELLAGGRPTNIGQGVGDMLNGIAAGIMNNRLDKAQAAGDASGATARQNIMAQLLGGTSAPLGDGAFPPAPQAPQGQQTSAGPISATGVDVAKRLSQDFGLSPAAAAGFAGNLAHESGDFKTLQEINPLVKGSRGGYGWAQWTGPRRRAFESWAQENRLDPSSPEANYGFLKHELTNTPEGSVLKALQGVNDPAQAAQIVSDKFLRPGIPHMGSRVSKSQKIANMLMGKDGGTQVASLDPSIGLNTAPQAAPSPLPAPQPQQVAQAAPQPVQAPQTMLDAGTPFERTGQAPQGIDLGALMQQAQNPWLDDNMRAMVNGIIQQEMQKRSPEYQHQQQMDQIGLQKAQLELQQMQNPSARFENVGGRLVKIGPDGSVEEAYAPPPEPIKEPAKPAEIQEYEYAKAQGFGGTLQDWKASQKGGMSIQTNPDGTMTFQQGANIKPLTEAQSKDTVYATRAEGALPILDQYADSLTGVIGNTVGQLPLIGNALKPDEFQKAEQAGNEFLQAILRKDTGAAITKDEQFLYGGTYLPRMGDGPEVLEQKRIARTRALEALKSGMTPQAILAQEQALAKVPQAAQPSTPDFSKMSDAELEALINGQ